MRRSMRRKSGEDKGEIGGEERFREVHNTCIREREKDAEVEEEKRNKRRRTKN